MRIPAEPVRPWWRPTVGVVTALCLGIWLGATLTQVGGIVETIALWFGVLGAGLGAGRLSRTWMQRRRERR